MVTVNVKVSQSNSRLQSGLSVNVEVYVKVKNKVRVKVRVRSPSSGLIQTRTDTRSRIRTGIRTEYADYKQKRKIIHSQHREGLGQVPLKYLSPLGDPHPYPARVVLIQMLYQDVRGLIHVFPCVHASQHSKHFDRIAVIARIAVMTNTSKR